MRETRLFALKDYRRRVSATNAICSHTATEYLAQEQLIRDTDRETVMPSA